MGSDATLRVDCRKVSTIQHTFATETPWREVREVRRTGYEIVRSTETDATLQKDESVNAPSLYDHGRLRRLEAIQRVFGEQHANYAPWCKWDFGNSTVLRTPEELRSTLRVWDALWADVFAVLEKDDEDEVAPWNEIKDASFAHRIHETLRDMFQYAVDNEDVHVVTSIVVEY